MNEYKIIADSICDLTPEMRRQWNAETISLTAILDGEEYPDNDELDVAAMVKKMKSSQKVSTACPAPMAYADAFAGAVHSFCVTVSDKLSGSYASAVNGKALAGEAADVHIFNSNSASAGEILLVMKLRELTDSGLSRESIIERADAFIAGMKTYFALNTLENFVKSGRLSRVKGKLIEVLGIKPIMGEDGNGNIQLHDHARGESQLIAKMSDTVAKSGKVTDNSDLVITHCNNLPLAEKLKAAIESKYNFRHVLVAATRGVSSVYANDGGIIMAF